MQYIQRVKRCGRLLVTGCILVLLAACDRAAFEDARGDTLNWDDLRGQWVVVNYWAEWCKPCLEEIPELNRLDRSERITVLGVNFDGITGQPLRDVARKMDIDFRLLAEDPGPKLGWDLPVGLPASFVVNPDGELVETRFGAQTEDGLMELMQP